LVAIRDKVAELKQTGRTLEETVAAKPTAARDAKWGQFVKKRELTGVALSFSPLSSI
jgi:hypothetical protein